MCPPPGCAPTRGLADCGRRGVKGAVCVVCHAEANRALLGRRLVVSAYLDTCGMLNMPAKYPSEAKDVADDE